MRSFLLRLLVSSVIFSSATMAAPTKNNSAAQIVSVDAGSVESKDTIALVTPAAADLEKKAQGQACTNIETACQAEAFRNAERVEVLQWIIIALSATLLVLLAILVFRQFYKARRMRILAMTDELTKLPNRRHILTFLGDQAKLAYENEQPFSIIVFDIDNFKQVNDKYGHDGGDIALAAVADIASQTLRRGDRVGRIGGEEFLVVLPGSGHKAAAEIAERLRYAIEVTEFDKLPSGLQLTVSLGVSEWNVGRESIDALLKRAGKALHDAKNGGRNCVVQK